LRRRKKDREEKIVAYLGHIKSLADLLAEDIGQRFMSIGGAYTEARIEELRGEADRLEEEKQLRVSAVANLVAEIGLFWTTMAIPESERKCAFSDVILSDKPGAIGLERKSIQALEDAKMELLTEKERRESIRNEKMAEIERIWERLKTHEEDREKFITGPGSSLTIEGLKQVDEKLARLREVQKERREALIVGLRERITEVWDAMRVSPKEKAEMFPGFYNDDFTEALLEDHEQFLAAAQGRLETLKPIFNLVDHREKQKREIADWDVRKREWESDPDRYKHRNFHKMCKEDERFARMRKVLVPKTEKKIREAVGQYEREFDTEFRVHGERYLAILERELEQEKIRVLEMERRKREEKETKKNNRKKRLTKKYQTYTPQRTTKTKSRTKGTPASARPRSRVRSSTTRRAPKTVAVGKRSKAIREVEIEDTENAGDVANPSVSTAIKGPSTARQLMDELVEGKDEEQTSKVSELQTAAESHVKKGEHQEAIKLFSKALEVAESMDLANASPGKSIRVKLHSQRSNAWAQLGEGQKAIEDSSAAIKLAQ